MIKTKRALSIMRLKTLQKATYTLQQFCNTQYSCSECLLNNTRSGKVDCRITPVAAATKEYERQWRLLQEANND